MRRETPLGLYKGLGAVLAGIIPKMAIRFTSFDWYKQALASEDGTISSKATFLGKSSYGPTIGAKKPPSEALLQILLRSNLLQHPELSRINLQC